MTALKNYTPRNNKYVEVLKNVENFYKGREKNIEGFKNKIFPLYYDKEHEYKARVERREEREKKEQGKQDEKTTSVNKFNEWINMEEKDMGKELFKKKI